MVSWYYQVLAGKWFNPEDSHAVRVTALADAPDLSGAQSEQLNSGGEWRRLVNASSNTSRGRVKNTVHNNLCMMKISDR